MVLITDSKESDCFHKGEIIMDVRELAVQKKRELKGFPHCRD